MAPILAQASIEATRRGDTGMYIATLSPLTTPSLLRRLATWQVISRRVLEGNGSRCCEDWDSPVRDDLVLASFILLPDKGGLIRIALSVAIQAILYSNQ